LLITCDLRRVEPLGFVPRFESSQVRVANLQPASIAARAGLQEGDPILRANGQVLEGRVDWQRVRAHLDPARPLALDIDRAGRSSTVVLALRAGLGEWRTGPRRPALLGFRLAQVITLAFALAVAFKRFYQPSALLGALLLASIATTSLVLPMRMVAFWQALPTIPAFLLWVPFATSVAAGPLLFAFAAVFPRPAWSVGKLCVALLPAALVVGWHVYGGYQVSRDLGSATGLRDGTTAIAVVNVVYAVLAVGLMLANRRRAETLTDRRRIGVLILGSVIGACAGVGVVVGYWRDPGADIFANRTLTLLSLVFLAVPASFAYAILRHRLFDIRLIVRQGLRYALARRFIDALIPALGVLLLVDVVLHRDQPVSAMIESRWWWFTLIGLTLVVARSRREQWLKSVDRRFFRERYDAQRLLTSIADQVTRAPDFDTIAPAIMQQIDEALRPAFVTLLRYVPAESRFSAAGSGSSADQSASLPASLTVIGVLAVLRKPLALSHGDTAWVRHQLPIDERSLLVEHGIELLVPISSQTAGELPPGLLALGPRRSEEPYGQEDLDLLVTIAHAVGVLLERSLDEGRAVAECEHCGRCFHSGAHVCADDGHALTAVRGSLLLNGRYRLERRLGRGGMGVVYAAVDEVLERPVAVKVIRDEIVGPLNLADRFRREARAAAAFAHPHVVRVYDFGVDRSSRAFLVMELLEGTTLRQRMASGSPLAAPEALHVLRGVCAALSAAHGQGIVHRDLKPENIFLQRHATGIVPKVLDFGLAKAFDARPATDRSTAMGTSAGLLVGTLAYMSPEQVAGDDVSPGWDVWAAGVIAYEMLTGIHPFSRAVAVVGKGLADLSAGGRQSVVLSEPVSGFFRRALSTERSLRPREARDLLSECERVLA
jgi:serine/threonine-protein kinase